MKPHTEFTALVAVAMLLALVAPARAVIVFTEDFETPDVAGYSQGTTPSGWVRASVGYRSSYHGITDKASGDFSAPDPNHQAYAFRYTNSGIATAEGVLSGTDGLLPTSTYTLSFDVTKDYGSLGSPPKPGLPYKADLVAVPAGASRTDMRGSTIPPGSSLLASTSGNAPSDGSFANAGLAFTPDASHSSVLGYDVGVIFRGATDSAIIDNVSFDIFTPVVVDNTPPTPDPMTWNVVPTGVDYESITMRATTATDTNGVEYLFTNTTTGNTSGWQYKTEWFETGLAPDSTYTYEVKARDLSPNQNETGSSTPLSATTLPPIEGLIFKGSFEDPDITGLTSTDPTGWASAGHPGYTGLNDENSGALETPYGAQVARIYSTASLTTTPSILDEVVADPLPGTKMLYTLTFNVAERFDREQYDTRFAVDLLAGSTVLATLTGEVTTTDMSEVYSLIYGANFGDPYAGEPLAIRLRKGAGGDWQSNPQYDNVILTGVLIPEPASLSLLGLGGLALLRRRRRRA